MKLGLTALKCKCGKHYCSQHRYETEHGCTYDYQEAAKKELLKTMSSPVVAAKVAMI